MSKTYTRRDRSKEYRAVRDSRYLMELPSEELEDSIEMAMLSEVQTERELLTNSFIEVC